jgi:hypothetical protein
VRTHFNVPAMKWQKSEGPNSSVDKMQTVNWRASNPSHFVTTNKRSRRSCPTATCGLPAIMFLVARVNWSKLKVTPVRNYAQRHADTCGTRGTASRSGRFSLYNCIMLFNEK